MRYVSQMAMPLVLFVSLVACQSTLGKQDEYRTNSELAAVLIGIGSKAYFDEISISLLEVSNDPSTGVLNRGDRFWATRVNSPDDPQALDSPTRVLLAIPPGRYIFGTAHVSQGGRRANLCYTKSFEMVLKSGVVSYIGDYIFRGSTIWFGNGEGQFIPNLDVDAAKATIREYPGVSARVVAVKPTRVPYGPCR